MVEQLLQRSLQTATYAGERAADRISNIFEEADRVHTTIRFVHTDQFSRKFYFNERYTTVTHRFQTGESIDAYSVLLFNSDMDREIVDSYSFSDIETKINPTKFFDSKLREVGHTISNGFIDEWADRAGTDIDLSTPELRRGVYPEMLLPDELRWMSGIVPLFETHIKAGDHYFKYYLILSSKKHIDTLVNTSFGGQKAELGDFPVSVETIIANSALTVEENINKQLKNIEMDLTDWSLQYTLKENILQETTSERLIGSSITLTESVNGVAYVGFDPDLAKIFAEDLLGQIDKEDKKELTQSVINEISMNILTSFSDGWADIGQSEIDYTPPIYFDRGYDEAVKELKKEVYAEEVFILSAIFKTDDGKECFVLITCEPEGLVNIAEQLRKNN